MTNFNAEQIKQLTPKIHYKNQYGKDNVLFPLQWLILCGWDKISYDEYLTKYTAGAIKPSEEEAFMIIYTSMLDILSTIESMSAYGVINYNYYKTLMEQYGGSGLVSNKQQQNIKERVAKYKKQQEQVNSSGLEIK